MDSDYLTLGCHKPGDKHREDPVLRKGRFGSLNYLTPIIRLLFFALIVTLKAFQSDQLTC